MNFIDSPTTRARRYAVNRTSDNNFLNMPRGLPLVPDDYNRERSVYVQQMPIGLQVFDRIHSAIANAERRLLTNPHEEPDLSHIVSPISMLNLNNEQQEPQNPGMYGLLPRTQAPLEFDCGVCFEKIRKGQPQQLLNCGHKFCGSCFDKWAAQSGNTTCPSCRTPVYTQSMNNRPMGRAAPSHLTGRRNVRVATSSRFNGSQGMTPQQQAMQLFMRRG